MKQPIKEVINEIIEQLNLCYDQLEKSNKTHKDYEKFGKIVEGIYKSYYNNSNEMHTIACLQILKMKPKTKKENEILRGNYGLWVSATKVANIAREEAIKVKTILDEKTFKTYTKGMNICDLYVIRENKKFEEEVGLAVDGLIAIL